MKLGYVLSASLIASCAVGIALPNSTPSLDAIFRDHFINLTDAFDTSALAESRARAAATDQEQWTANVTRGRKLLAAMKSTDFEAATLFKLGMTAKSRFDGDLKAEMREWGWNDDTDALKKKYDAQCDFANYHKITKCFEELGLETGSKGSDGPNECFVAEHWDGPTVKKILGFLPKVKDQRYEACGTKLWSTAGYHHFGINAPGGAVMALDHVSSFHSAEQLWGRKPKDYELPAIRSASDVAWAFWNRATAGGDLKNIKYFFNCLIVNEETQALIRMAHEKMTPPRSAPGKWPGTEFSMNSEQGLALLGSPLGRWGGYFLMQHKERLGGDKYISKVRVFKNDGLTMPYMLFYVQDPGAAAMDASDNGVMEVMRNTHNSTISWSSFKS